MEPTITTITSEYPDVTAQGYTLQFRKTDKQGKATIVCYLKKEGRQFGFVSYGVENSQLMIQLNSVDLTAVSALMKEICKTIETIKA